MPSKIIENMSHDELIRITSYNSDTTVARIYRILTNTANALEQDACQRRPMEPYKALRFKLQAVNDICALFDIGLE